MLRKKVRHKINNLHELPKKIKKLIKQCGVELDDNFENILIALYYLASIGEIELTFSKYKYNASQKAYKTRVDDAMYVYSSNRRIRLKLGGEDDN